MIQLAKEITKAFAQNVPRPLWAVVVFFDLPHSVILGSSILVEETELGTMTLKQKAQLNCLHPVTPNTGAVAGRRVD